jgi:hypothetical protein
VYSTLVINGHASLYYFKEKARSPDAISSSDVQLWGFRCNAWIKEEEEEGKLRHFPVEKRDHD